MNCCIVCCKGIVHIILELEVVDLLVLYQKSKQDIVMSKFRRVMTILMHWGRVGIGHATLTFGRCLYLTICVIAFCHFTKKNTRYVTRCSHCTSAPTDVSKFGPENDIDPGPVCLTLCLF